MNAETAIPLVKGIVKQFLRIKNQYSSGGSTIRSRYCYSVWFRHLNHWSKHRQGIPEVVAELGPGDSLGIGLSALLSGSKQLHTLDVVKYWHTARNLKKFNDLVELFKRQIDIPGEDEFPRVKPNIDDYHFPSKVLTDDILRESLNEDRLNAIRKEIQDIENPNNQYIKCHVPWHKDIIPTNSIDLIYSQSVLQYMEDLDYTFKAMKHWLKSNGLMSHSIDLSSIGITNNWNSHWTFSDFEWQLMKSGKDFIINRLPYSAYLKQHDKYQLKILEHQTTKKENKLNPNQIANAFKDFTEEDLKTSDLHILSQNK